jgi:hypothetical protein
MQTYITADGVKHPIRDDFLIYPEGWTEPEENRVLERWRAGVELPADEREYLTAWNNRNNLETAWKWLDGDYRDHGFTTLCQVHGQSWSPDVCGCTIHQVFDHHTRSSEEPIEIRPHRLHKVCERHAGVTDHVEHHDTLIEECRHKEAVLSAVTDAHGLEVKDRPAWSFNENHELVIDTSTHAVLTPQHVNRIIQEQFSHAVVHVR